MLSLKQMNKLALIEKCITDLDSSIAEMKSSLQSLEEDMQNDTKSSAGDKFETSREMMSQEREKLMYRINLQQKQRNMLAHLPTQKKNKAGLGSLIFTDKQCFFLSQSLGKRLFQGFEIIFISVQAPIAQQLINKEVGDGFQWNGTQYKIVDLV